MSNSSSTPSSLAPLDRSSWKRVRLGDVLNYEQPYPYIVKSTEYEKAGIPVLTPGKTFILGYTHETEGVCHASFESPKILFDDFLTISRLVQFDFKVKSSALKILTPVSDKFNIYFLFYAMSLLKFEVTDHQRHWIERFSKLEIQIPDKAVQDKIASSLSAVDGHLASLEELVSKYEAIKKSTVSLLLRPQPTWQTKPLGDLSFIKTGTRNTQDAVKDGKYPFFVRSPIVERINTFSFDGEAVLVAGDGVGAGKVFHYVNGKHDCHQRVYRLCNFSAEVCGRYVYHVLTSRFPIYMEQRNDKASVDSLRLPTFKEFPVQYPEIDEQRKIVHAIDTCDAMLSSLAAEREKLASLKRGLLRHFFG